MSKFTVVKLDSEPAIPPVKNEKMYTSELSLEQQIAFEKFVKGENIFVTGPGGTGKTKLVKNLVEYANSIEKPGQVCAMTGCAAVLIGCKARTIHSWSGIKLAKGPKDKIIANVMKNRNAVKEWKFAKYLILDEVSMLSQKIFEILEELSRKARKNPAVFGGLQVVFLGDFFQLPPIETENDPGSEKFCFESPIWHRVFPTENHIELTKIFRQNDPIYIDILMQIRRGYLEKDKVELLETYVNREYDPEKHNGCVPTKLFAIRSKVDLINKQMFSKIDEKEYVSEVIIKTDCTTNLDSGKALSPELLQKCNMLSVEQKDYEVENLLNNSTCSKLFRFKKGASVMCTVNLDMDNQICNGAQGIIIDILEEGLFPIVVVKFSNGIVKRIIHHFWQSEEYPTIAVGQYPLILAWALTIHKIQGATMKLAEIDIGTSIFEYGQTYVALSRIQSLDGLYLSAFQPQKIRANPTVVEFYNRIQK
jgi:ATP-dependent DNA helicase PIF1